MISLDPQGLKGIACHACSRRSFPQRPLCPHCGADTVDNVVLSDRGRVASWTVVHQAPPPLKTPYTLVTVDLDDGVRLLGAAVGDIQIDSTVAVELFTLEIRRPRENHCGGTDSGRARRNDDPKPTSPARVWCGSANTPPR